MSLATQAIARAEEVIASASAASSANAAIVDALNNTSAGVARNAADHAADFANSAHIAADDASVRALDIARHSEFATEAGRAWSGLMVAHGGRADAEMARDAGIAANSSAEQAINSHNGAVALAAEYRDAASSAAAHAELQRNNAFFHRDFAIAHSDQAQVVFDDGGSQQVVAELAWLAEGSAFASNAAAILTQGWWIESSSNANLALAQAEVSQQASLNYGSALAAGAAASANAAAAGVTASLGATTASNAVAAAAPLAGVIASEGVLGVYALAVQARDLAISHHASALAAQSAAADAAQSARTMGERVFFSRTAEIAQAAMAHSIAAREFADQAIAAAAQARTAADAAAALVGGALHSH
jgi:hypothetical protein